MKGEGGGYFAFFCQSWDPEEERRTSQFSCIRVIRHFEQSASQQMQDKNIVKRVLSNHKTWVTKHFRFYLRKIKNKIHFPVTAVCILFLSDGSKGSLRITTILIVKCNKRFKFPLTKPKTICCTMYNICWKFSLSPNTLDNCLIERINIRIRDNFPSLVRTDSSTLVTHAVGTNKTFNIRLKKKNWEKLLFQLFRPTVIVNLCKTNLSDV